MWAPAMKRKAKLPFDPKVFLAKVNGGRAHFRISERSNCVQAGRSCGFCFLHSERQGQEDRRLRAGQGSRGRTSGNRRFLRRRLSSRGGAASVDGHRSDEMHDRANIKGGHHSRDPRRAGVCRVVYRAPAWPATVGSRRTWSINCSIRARNVWRGLFCLLANFGKEGRPEPIIAKVSQETLAEMIGTTRSRVSFFMNKFRKLGLIDYNGSIEIHSSLLNVVLHDQPQIRK